MAQLEVSAIRRQLARMAKSRAFAQAGRMFPLLEYLVAVELDI